MSGLHNLNKPFFRSDYGLVVCLLVVFAYASFVIYPGVQAGWSSAFFEAHLVRILVATGLLMAALSALFIHLYLTPENGEARWAPLRWGGLAAGVLAVLLLLWPIYGVKRTVANFEPVFAGPTTDGLSPFGRARLKATTPWLLS